ncbi:hypothetical protein RJ639_034374 [Escallonia herrerae]|uniref:Vacuolar protein sorting-associated protein 13 VPS13 adaptor binding domain-containing protein n=1 Tax=Escallonia herrerae TaxID=1293975 RepID=A0AA88WYZ7_9ASTE|nr:hypothetical protein RJ639_034374 [Escallonia herrerae]
MTIITYSGKSKEDGHIICSSENTLGANSAHQHEMGFGSCTLNENCDDKNTSADGCFLLHYEAYRNMESVSHKYMIRVNDLDLHCYPYIIALLVGFAERMSEYGTSEDVEDSLVVEEQGLLSIPGFEFQSFGCSNFVGNGSSEWASIPVDQFPFVTIHNLGSLLNLENSLIYGIPDWRKVLHLRDRKIRSTKFSVKKGSKSLFVPPVRSTSRKDGLHMQHNFDDTNLFLVDLNLSSSRVHFHDSSCIVGTIMLPTSKSSFSISPNSLDVLCSTSGLVLSTSWWTQNLHDFLWGPSSADLSPVLNFRVRKGGSESLRSHFEISFSVQHVCCILPAEFLAILIGYFSLPDWKYDGKEPVTESSEETEDNVMTFKFEILDSTLFVPVEREGPQFLKVDIQQLVCSFIHKSDRHIVLKDIPSECLVPPNKFACKNHCLNLFGRDLSLSVLLPKDDAFGQRDISLIAPLSADVWIRIPRDCESSSVSPFAPTCIMARVNICQLIAEDNHALVGYEALLAVGDQFSLVHNESQGFTSDILQFLQHKRSIKENSALPPESLNIIFTEIRCSVHTMSIEFYSSRRESISSTLVSKVEMRFTCSASLRDDKPVCLDMSFSSLALFSYLNSVMLAECISPCSISSILDIKMSVSAEGTHRLYVSLPSLDIWLYLSDWSEVIDLLSSYPRSKTSTVNASVEKSNVGPVGQIEVPKYSPPRSGMSSSFALENMKQDVVFIGRSENVGITIHIPVKVNGEAFRIFQEPEVRQERPLNDTCKAFGGNQYGFIVVTFCSRCVELLNNGDLVRLNSNFEKTSGTVEVQFEKTVRTWPFFQLSHFNLEAEIWDHAAKQVHGIVDVRCDSLDVWLSHHIFSFWGCMLFEFPKAGSSEFAFSGLDLSVRLRKLSLLITDGKTEPLVKGNFCGIATAVTQSILTSEFCFRSALKVLIEEWRSNGPLLELLTRNVLLHCKATENELEGSVVGELQLNFYNIHKVLWEPFIEPWEFHLSITRRNEQNVLLNSAIFTDINLNSEKQLNLNLTESLIEVAFRASDMIKDALSVQSESPRFSRSQISGNAYNATYAPYMLQNLTSLPLVFHVRQGPITAYDLNVSAFKDEKCLQPGSSIPVFINETPGEQLFRCRPVHSSDRISDKQFMEEGHRYVFIQLEGTSRPSPPISMDLVGLSYVEVDFSKSSQNAENDIVGDELKSNKSFEGNNKADSNSGYVVPVVVDVSIQQYTKIIRLYSTVILLNATSVPFEVRFDIPFGVSPKILDPIHPGKELPLPLHLAETGRMRWRPLGNTYLWSEAYNISNLLSHENKIGFLRSFICYPSHPSSDPFRCCISVYNISATLNQSVENSGPVIHNADKSAKRYIHLVTLSSPFVVKNYLPVAFSLAIESGGVTRTALLSEVESTFFHIDYSHDLAITFNMHGFRPSHLKFPRAETFGATAKFSGSKFSLFETITFCSDLSDGPLCVTVEKVMDAFSGAREICLSVPFLLYNCTGFSIILSNCVDEMKGRGCTLPSCYDLDEQDLQLGKKDGLGLLSSNQYLPADARNDRLRNSSLNDHIVSTRKNVDTHPNYYTSKALNFSGTCKTFCRGPEKHDLDSRKSNLKSPGFEEVGYKKANARMYSPDSGSSASELTVRVCRDLSERVRGNIPNYSWSTPFLLVPPTGSTSVLVPQPTPNAAYVISVASSAASGPLCEKTRIISFQPRYVISNACSKDICYKQKGTDFSFHLWIGQHSHIHWTDTTSVTKDPFASFHGQLLLICSSVPVSREDTYLGLVVVAFRSAHSAEFVAVFSYVYAYGSDP